MESRSKCQKLSEEVKLKEAEDRINNLPRCIVGHILSFLPTKYAVGTSILSTKWKHMWTSIRNLDLDDILFLSSANRNGDQWKISFMTSGLLPADLFTCNQLVVQKLGYNRVLNVPKLVCVQSLKTLLLGSVKFRDDESAKRLLSGCPVLEVLALQQCGGKKVSVLSISAPVLKGLIVSYPVPKNSTLKVIGFCDKLPVFHNLTSLELGINRDDAWELLGGILESSPNLRTLVFVEGLLQEYHFYEQDWDPPDRVPTCLLESLVVIEMRKLEGKECELNMVKYFLNNVKFLRR
ncbi:putative F-box/FBD/LRR-repeat protein [Camellia lanceoleosa]|uniref:F-box/FBD/LRR-repeat protein n=1 Tax=Camellia lanceoleosa TaxID=1840588 RepID=A0ACC0H8L9_9ERIC|nr:putative F-box/FBD/LRR-repeat protein [Camellia lanceoleosa]